MPRSKRKVVIGIGEIIAGDRGLGKHALRHLMQDVHSRKGFEFIEAGTAGFDVEQIIEESSHLLVLDAADAGRPPGTIIEFERNEIDVFGGLRLMAHQTEFHTMIIKAGKTGKLPQNLHFIGMQPNFFTPGFDLSKETRKAIPEMLHRATTVLHTWEQNIMYEKHAETTH